MPNHNESTAKIYSSSSIAEIKAALSLHTTIEKLTGIKFANYGERLKACCPFHQEKTPSFIVNKNTGRYKCFGAGCGKSGDVIQFIADWYSLSISEAILKARELAGMKVDTTQTSPMQSSHGQDSNIWLGILPKPCIPNRRSKPNIELTAIPDHVILPKPGELVTVEDSEKKKLLYVNTTHIHVYRKFDGTPLCLVLRANKSDGGKFFIQVKWEKNKTTPWKMLRFAFGNAKPLYGLEAAPTWLRKGGKHLLIVEGETTRDAATQLLPLSSGWMVLTIMGGSNSVKLADWDSLIHLLRKQHQQEGREFKVVIWPDADKIKLNHLGKEIDPQIKFTNDVNDSILQRVDKNSSFYSSLKFICVNPPNSAPHGWDLADAVKEGWTKEKLLDYLSVFNVSSNEIDPRFVAEPL